MVTEGQWKTTVSPCSSLHPFGGPRPGVRRLHLRTVFCNTEDRGPCPTGVGGRREHGRGAHQARSRSRRAVTQPVLQLTLAPSAPGVCEAVLVPETALENPASSETPLVWALTM